MGQNIQFSTGITAKFLLKNHSRFFIIFPCQRFPTQMGAISRVFQNSNYGIASSFFQYHSNVISQNANSSKRIFRFLAYRNLGVFSNIPGYPLKINIYSTVFSKLDQFFMVAFPTGTTIQMAKAFSILAS